jgi:hypothetical protein
MKTNENGYDLSISQTELIRKELEKRLRIQFYQFVNWLGISKENTFPPEIYISKNTDFLACRDDILEAIILDESSYLKGKKWDNKELALMDDPDLRTVRPIFGEEISHILYYQVYRRGKKIKGIINELKDDQVNEFWGRICRLKEEKDAKLPIRQDNYEFLKRLMKERKNLKITKRRCQLLSHQSYGIALDFFDEISNMTPKQRFFLFSNPDIVKERYLKGKIKKLGILDRLLLYFS